MLLKLSYSSLVMLVMAGCGGRTLEDASSTSGSKSGNGVTPLLGTGTQDASSTSPSGPSSGGSSDSGPSDSGSRSADAGGGQDAASTSPGSPPPPPGIVSLVTWPRGASGLALDAVNLYWADGQNVMKTPKAGGTTVALTDAVPLQSGAPTSWVGLKDGLVFADQSSAVISVPTVARWDAVRCGS